MDAIMNMTKTCLINTTLYKNHVMSVKQQTNEIAFIRCINFFKYKPLIIRFRKGKSSYNLALRNGCFEIALSLTERYQTIDCFVIYDLRGKISDTVIAIRISGKKYKIVLPLEMLENCDRVNEDLNLAIRFISGRESPLRLYPLLRRRSLYEDITELPLCFVRLNKPLYTEEDEISFRMEDVWKMKMSTDFVIHVQGGKIHAHKALLASRSTYFRNAICEKGDGKEQNGAVRIGATTYEAAIAVIRFLYTGSLVVCPLGKMIAVFELARRLNVQGLLDQCGTHLLKYVKDCDLPPDEKSRWSTIDKFIANHYRHAKRQNTFTLKRKQCTFQRV